jgi:hypothetical protein
MRHIVAGLRALAGDLAYFSHSLLLDIGTAALSQGRDGPADDIWPEIAAQSAASRLLEQKMTSRSSLMEP